MGSSVCYPWLMNLRSLFPFFLSLAFIGSASAEDIKCATVDANKLLIKYHVATKEISALQEKRKKYEAERVERNKALVEVETKIKDLITQIRDKSIPNNERNTLTGDYEDLVSKHNAIRKDLQESDQEQIQAIRSKIAEATRRLLDEIHGVIGQYAKDNKYHWVIDTSGVSNTQISPLIYARETTDITDEILAIINKDAPEEDDSEEEEETDSE